jgi:hypothetical protein
MTDTNITGDSTVAEAREWVHDEARTQTGGHCPVCDQLAKVYRRSIHRAMARDLVTAYRVAGREWFHMPTLPGYAGGDTAKLAYWRLIEPRPGVRADGSNRVGWWKITQLGEAWVRGKIGLPQYALVYNGRCLGLDLDGPRDYTIRDALGGNEAFNYDRLMSQPIPSV